MNENIYYPLKKCDPSSSMWEALIIDPMDECEMRATNLRVCIGDAGISGAWQAVK